MAVALASAIAATSLAPAASGKGRPISAVEVKTLVRKDDGNLRTALRESVEREVSALDFSKAKGDGSYVLGAALVKLDTETKGDAARVSCRVSVTLRDAKRGALLAILDGSARAEAPPSARDEAERGALAVAVKEAVHAVPEAIRRAADAK